MATRNVAGVPSRPETSTEFQLYGVNGGKNLVDFTEQKLMRYASKTKDPQQKLVLMSMLEDYRGGLIAVAWRRGAAVYYRMTKDA